jgi:hypothetical protein
MVHGRINSACRRGVRSEVVALVGVLVAGCGGGASAPESEAGSWFGTTQRAIGPGPDLVVRSLVAPPVLAEGGLLRAQVCNEGDQPAPAMVGFVVSTDATLDPAFAGPWAGPGADVLIERVNGPILEVDACADLELTMPFVPPPVVPGSGYLFAVADPDDCVGGGQRVQQPLRARAAQARGDRRPRRHRRLRCSEHGRADHRAGHRVQRGRRHEPRRLPRLLRHRRCRARRGPRSVPPAERHTGHASARAGAGRLRHPERDGVLALQRRGLRGRVHRAAFPP